MKDSDGVIILGVGALAAIGLFLWNKLGGGGGSYPYTGCYSCNIPNEGYMEAQLKPAIGNGPLIPSPGNYEIWTGCNSPYPSSAEGIMTPAEVQQTFLPYCQRI